MARKVNLKTLLQNSKLSVNVTGTATGGTDALFDGNSVDSALVIEQDGPLEVVELVFDPILQGREFQLILTYQGTYNGSIEANGNTIFNISDSASNTNDKQIRRTFSIGDNSGLQNLTFNLGSTTSGNTDSHTLHEIELFITSVADPFEFNDSLLSSKAWNSSRYDGRQLQASQINVARKSDIGNNNRTPIIQKYSRNIYIGNRVIGLGNDSIEDKDLVQYDGFSYATTNFYITVNNDDSITFNRLKDVGDRDAYKKIGFYQAFFDDFAEESNAKIVLGDNTVTDQLKAQYPVYFNGGQLQKLFVLNPIANSTGDLLGVPLIHTSGSNVTSIAGGGTSGLPNTSIGNFTGLKGLGVAEDTRVINISMDVFSGTNSMLHFGVNVLNQDLFRNFYTASLSENGKTISPNTSIQEKNFNGIFNAFFTYKNGSNYTGNKRLFVTMISASAVNPNHGFSNGGYQTGLSALHGGISGSEDILFYPLILNQGENLTASLDESILKTNLSYVSTGEVQSHLRGVSDQASGTKKDTFKIALTNKHKFIQNYQSLENQSPIVGGGQSVFGLNGQTPSLRTAIGTPTKGFTSGSVLFSQANDSIPSLLLRLRKTSELPDGTGDKPFILLPDNLHPHIEENLTFYLAKAGINIGDDTVTVVEEQTSKKSPIRPTESAAMAALRRQAFEAERRRNALPRAERRRRRQERREDRQERREERREDRQERRENRRENRQERREDRQERRRERRRNRRRRR